MNETELRKLDDEMVGAYVNSDVDLILSHCSDDIVMHDYGFEPVRGKDACREHLAAQFAPMSQQSAQHLRRIFGYNEVFGELDWTATHSGDMTMPDGTIVPPTGKMINIRVAYYSSINEHGEVEEIRSYSDVMSMLAQLGLVG